jgi:hypothetical protein
MLTVSGLEHEKGICSRVVVYCVHMVFFLMCQLVCSACRDGLRTHMCVYTHNGMMHASVCNLCTSRQQRKLSTNYRRPHGSKRALPSVLPAAAEPPGPGCHGWGWHRKSCRVVLESSLCKQVTHADIILPGFLVLHHNAASPRQAAALSQRQYSRRSGRIPPGPALH